MTHGDDFSIPTTPIAPGRERGPWLVVIVLAAGLVGAFAVARWTDAPDSRRAPPSARPTAVAEVVPPATPLPLQQWFSASAAPLDDVLVEAGTIRRLHLARARLTDEPLAQPGRDLLLPAPRGGTVCLCWRGSRFETGDPRSLDLVRLDSDQRELARTTITVVGGFEVPGRTEGPTHVALEPSPDGRFAYLARAVRSATQWQVSLDVIDLAEARIVDAVDLVAVPQADDTPVARLDAPTLRVAPDGRHLLVTATAARVRFIGPDRITSRAWIVGLDDARTDGVVAADGVVVGTGQPCDWIAFVTPSIIAQGCQDPTAEPAATFEIRRHDLEGRDLGAVPVEPWRAESGDPLVDTTNGIVYAWDPVAHTLRAVDLLLGRQRDAGPPPEALDAPGSVLVSGERPPPGSPVKWSDGRPTTDAQGERALVGSPDGRLLFAVGSGPDQAGSSGIWVFDAATLELIERWPALASYASLALLEDGRWLAAIGRPGVTAAGALARWGTSMTIHDTTTGRPVLRIGDLRAGTAVTFPWPGPPAHAE